MNFLAHSFLSGDNPKILIGNFIGDFVKGRNLLEQFDPDIALGIELHRGIDAFTDTHPIVALSKQRLRPTYRHYSAVIVDMYYDHFLAANWQRYHTLPLQEYACQVYDILKANEEMLPQQVKYMLSYMIPGNWLLNYAHTEGIHRALSGMARRSRHESKMELAVHNLVEYYDEFEKEFSSFFPELQSFSADFLFRTNNPDRLST